MKRVFTLTFFSFLLIITSAVGQEAMEKFGKNRVQYKNFKWRYYSTENFDIYFYDGGNEIATVATGYLEKEFDRITDLLGSVSYSKTEIYLYNSPTDLLQSNIGVNDNSFDVAGQTDFVKPMVEIAYPGNAEEFKKELIFKISSMLIYDMMFGGSFSDMFQNSYLLMLPEWYMNGAAKYAASGWDTKMDDFIRDLIRNRGLKNISKYTGDKAELIGQSIWNYIAEKYGVSYISNILNLTRIIRNEERSISGTLGVPYKSFLAEWEMYYTEQASFIDQNYKLPAQNNRKTVTTRESNLTDVKMSPEGNYYAYSTNMNGKYKVLVGSTGRSKEKTALGGGYRLINQEPEYNLPLLSWRDENTLAIITTKYGRYYMVTYELSSGKKVRKELTTINQVRDFDILKNGNLAVISADRNGDSDLYLISLKRNSIKRITTDFFDDVNPRFIPGTSSIIFSSNRTTDSIDVKGRDIGKITDTYNLFIYNIDTTKNTVFRVTNTLSKNTHPVPVNENEYYYISEQQGIANLFKYDYSKKIAHQVSDFGSGIKDFDISTDKRFFGFVMGDNGKDNLYIDDSYDLNKNIFTAQTKRQQYLSAKMVAQRLKAARERKALDAINTEILPDSSRTITTDQKAPESRKPSSFLDAYQQNLNDEPSTENIIDLDNYSFADVQPSKPVVEAKPDNDMVDTDGYVFDTDVVKSGKNTGSVLSAYRRLRKESDVAGPYPYQTQFSADNIVTSFVIDPMIGFGLKLETQMNDQLENHKFYGGVLVPTDLKSGSFYGEYRYLKYTLDFGARYSRKSLYRNVDESNSEQRYILNTYELSASLPLNVKSRLSIVPFIETTKFWDTGLFLGPLPNSPAR
ncbi:MAG: translocation protein TolB [Cyclobacteriaceae bacterium]|nr:translocation protein TolB [Cyclobacteriaceae bacterium]